MIDYQQSFHTGVRVPDLDEAMRQLGGGLGITWASVQERDQPLWTPAHGLQRVPLRFTYSCEGPQHIELLQGAPGSLWDGGPAPGPHHMGVWVEDVAAETQRLVTDGWGLVGAGAAPEDGYGAFTYAAPAGGPIVELVAAAAQPRFEHWWAGGNL